MRAKIDREAKIAYAQQIFSGKISISAAAKELNFHKSTGIRLFCRESASLHRIKY